MQKETLFIQLKLIGLVSTYIISCMIMTTCSVVGVHLNLNVNAFALIVGTKQPFLNYLSLFFLK